MVPLALRSGPLDPVMQAAGRVIFGKAHTVRLAVTCLLAGGHLLIEDLPGLGKTTLAHALAQLFGLKLARIQFTSDLLPADITGVSVFEREHGTFRFVPGPVFSQLILADEINRATPKTQSALLEAMEERQVSCEGETRPLPSPFFVIATQNPSSQIGTFPLPESQLDRFLMRIDIGYPDHQAERALLERGSQRLVADQLGAWLDPETLQRHQAVIAGIHAGPALLDYLQALLAATRRSTQFVHGLSPRAGLALLAAARAWCWLDGREAVLPDDLQAVFPAVAGHRLRLSDGSGLARRSEISELLQATPIP